MSLEQFSGDAYQGGAATFHGIAAQQDQARTPFIQSDLSKIEYWVRNMTTDAYTKSAVQLTITDVISDTVDDYKKNFHVPFPDDSFPDAVSYEVTFRFTASDTASTETYGTGIIRVEPVTLPAP